MFDTRGRFLRRFGNEGSAEGCFKHPLGIAFDRAGQVLIVDNGNDRIQIFKPDGTFVTAFGEKGSAPEQFSYVRAVAVDREGRIVVGDQNKGVLVFGFAIRCVYCAFVVRRSVLSCVLLAVAVERAVALAFPACVIQARRQRRCGCVARQTTCSSMHSNWWCAEKLKRQCGFVR